MVTRSLLTRSLLTRSLLTRSLLIRRAAFVMAFGAVALSSSYAAAQGATNAGPNDLTTLERNLADESAALSTSDCATACRALASIRRAADRICALDPGERCAAGRAKADDATRRVREACPECAIASALPEPAPPREGRAMTKGGSRSPEADAQVAVQAAPPSESRRGGCAGCTTASASAPGDLAGIALAIAAVALATVRRRRIR